MHLMCKLVLLSSHFNRDSSTLILMVVNVAKLAAWMYWCTPLNYLLLPQAWQLSINCHERDNFLFLWAKRANQKKNDNFVDSTWKAFQHALQFYTLLCPLCHQSFGPVHFSFDVTALHAILLLWLSITRAQFQHPLNFLLLYDRLWWVIHSWSAMTCFTILSPRDLAQCQNPCFVVSV